MNKEIPAPTSYPPSPLDVPSACPPRLNATSLSYYREIYGHCTLHVCHHRSLTSVGGTQGITEIAAPISSGGFSTIFPQPKYQANAVAAYLATPGATALAGRFQRGGRGFPDVSAQAMNIEVAIGGDIQLLSGTSASSPIFASVVALINDARLSKGMPPVGFLNPMLYAKGAAALNDITRGSNPGCGTEGFPAAKGWDPVSELRGAEVGIVLTPCFAECAGDRVGNTGFSEITEPLYNADNELVFSKEG